MRFALVCIIAAALACLPPTVAGAGAQQTAPEPSTLQILEAAPQPVRDPSAIIARLTGVAPAVPTGLGDSLEVGRVDAFFVLDQSDNTYKSREAELRLVTEHAYWYLERTQRVSNEEIIRSARFFEDVTYPTVHRAFGSEKSPGVDGDPRITIFVGTVPGVGAYYSSWDQYPRSVYPYSNEREMVHINIGSLRPGSQGFDSTLAHEFQHMVHWNMNPADETWVDEGSAELASFLATGGRALSTTVFERRPDVQLTAWADSRGASAHYQAAFLFMQYFVTHYGGDDGLRGLFREQGRPPETFTRYLRARGHALTFDDVFLDWAVANLLDDPIVHDGRYHHPNSDPRVSMAGRAAIGEAPIHETVHQYGTDYLELAGDGRDSELVFEGDPGVPLVRVEPASGSRMWWSNRGDGLDAHMTRRFDLRGVSQATLRFDLWYETEKDFDYFYVMASTDAGRSWRVLPGAQSSDANPAGNAVGPGYTGRSGGGPAWVNEVVDLGSLVGNEVLIRFEYITDQAYNIRGVLIDNVAIDAIGFVDDAELDHGWTYEGFVRSDNVIPQPWGLRLVEYHRGGGITVRPLTVDPSGRLVERLPGLGGRIERVVVTVSGLAPRTLETAGYSVMLRPAR